MSAAFPDLCGKRWAEPAPPQPYGLMTDVDTAPGEQILDVTLVQWEPKMESDGLSDDGGWERVKGVRDRLHSDRLTAKRTDHVCLGDNAVRSRRVNRIKSF